MSAQMARQEENKVNSLLTELMTLETVAKQAQKRIDEIRNWCKEQGSFNTGQFVCAVLPRTRTCMVSLDTAIGVLGKEFLEESGLVQTTEYQIVSVSRK